MLPIKSIVDKWVYEYKMRDNKSIIMMTKLFVTGRKLQVFRLEKRVSRLGS